MMDAQEDPLAHIPTEQLLAAYKGDDVGDDPLAHVPTEQLLAAYKGDTGPTSWRRDVRRAVTNIPGLGAYADEAAAYYRHLRGEDYDKALASERARNEIANTEDTQKLLSTPVGDIYRSGLGKAAGAATALAFPELKVMQGAGILGSAANAAATGAGYSALGGFGAGEGDIGSRLGNAGEDAAIGAAIGAPLGGALGGVAKLAGRSSPAGVAAAAASEKGQAIQAAELLRSQGGAQELPEFIANSDNKGLRSFAGALNSMPSISAPMRRSAERTMEDLGANVQRIASEFAQQGTGAGIGAADAAAATEAGGQSLGDAIRNWIGPTSRTESSANYNAAYGMLPQGTQTMVDTPALRQALQSQMAKAEAAGLDVGNDLFKLVGEAATRPGGLTIDGLKTLRSDLASRANWSNIPEYTKLKDYVKPLVDAAKTDIRNGVSQFGGTQALKNYDYAAARHAEIANDREMLQKIVGKAREGDTSGAFSNARVVDNVRALAMTSNRMNDQQLIRVMQAVRASNSPQALNDFRAAVVRRMGESPGAAAGTPGTVAFSPDRLGTEYAKFSENGKSAIFGRPGSPQRDAMDAINTISNRFKTIRQFQNPSGTAQSAAWFELGLFGLDGHWLEPFGQIFGTEALGRWLSRPATARSISRFGTTVSNFAEGKAGRAAVRLATLNLARDIADDTGDSEKSTEMKLVQALPVARAQ